MTRLASRSPAAPFQSSRPAPMPQYPPQATKTTEAQTLRQMVQEREEKIRELEEEVQQLRKASYTAYKWLRALNPHIEAPVDRGPRYSVEQPGKHRSVMSQLEDALDGGGDDHASS